MNRREFLGALAAIVVAPLAQMKRTPTCWRCGKTGGPGWSVPGDSAQRWWKCKPCLERDYTSVTIHGQHLNLLQSRKLPPSMRIYGNPALIQRLFL